MKESVRRQVWVRAGGRCSMCGEYVLDGDFGSREVSTGEAAHIIGKGPRQSERKKPSRSPRSVYRLSDNDPDDPANLMILCPSHHRQVDAQINVKEIDVDTLRGIKQSHEDMIFHATSMVRRERTLVLRVIGRLHGRTVQCSRLEATGACMRSGQRLPDYTFAFGRGVIECDLRALPGERKGSADYYRIACAAIDEFIEREIHRASSTDCIEHLSIFAFARLPLLVYLGARLGDTVSADVYQRSRILESWDWPESDGRANFVVDLPDVSKDDELVLLINASATVRQWELPEYLQRLPIYTLNTDDATMAEPDVLRSREDLGRFKQAFYELLGCIEERHKTAKTLHLVAAAPISGAVVMGRAFRRDIHGSVVVYYRTEGTYRKALELW